MTDVGFRGADIRAEVLFAQPEARKSNCRPYENRHDYRASNSECHDPNCPIRRQSALRVVQVNEKHVHRQAKYQIEECNMSGEGSAHPNQKTIAFQLIHSLVSPDPILACGRSISEIDPLLPVVNDRFTESRMANRYWRERISISSDAPCWNELTYAVSPAAVVY